MLSQPKIVKNRDPFYVDPLPKAHYYPTEKKSLSTQQKKTAISPQRSTTEKRYEEERLSYNDELFLKGGNYITSKVNQDETSSSKFDESWPSTERPSSMLEEEHPLNDIIFQRNGDRFADLKQTLKFAEKDPSSVPSSKPKLLSENGNMRQDSSSTLQKYIDRFRTGQPMSREERTKASESSQRDFWWLSDKSFTDSSTPKDDSPGAKRTRRFTPHSPINPYKGHSDKKSTAQFPTVDTLDDTTKFLQDKADRLLDSASSVASSDPIVSTDGLGSSFSTTLSSVEEQAYRPAFAAKFDKPERHAYQIPKPQGRQPTRPEEDVLYQWRLRRRMEQARDTAAKTPNTVKFGYKDKIHGQKEVEQKLEEFKQKLAGKQVQQNISLEDTSSSVGNISGTHISHVPVHFTPALEFKVQQEHSHNKTTSSQKFPVASPMLPHTKGADKIEPHYHLSCDLLPCSHQGYKLGHDFKKIDHDENSEEKQAKEKKISKSESKSNIKEKDFCDENLDSDRYKFLQAERPDIESKEKVESENEKSDCSDLEHSINDQKEYIGDTKTKLKENKKFDKEEILEKRLSDKNQFKKNKDTKLRSRDNKDGKDRIPELKKSEKQPVAKPPVENAIGQVIKDRLFDISNSTVLSSIDSEPPSPQRIPKFTRGKQQKHQETTEYEDDSDGEYPDDQLLSMLRQQRKQYEGQLRQIDEMLAKLEPDDS